ncbi:MAG TPA: gluconate 2-dehydrogenase subunit 3 family protein [Steroidobacteraceae bacterium]|nr:gluconate 2-dehydrogenase subunit 3 family protein [Steroidobacteraceae bacterium]
MSAEVRFPGYDVLAKHDGKSWNEATRRTLDARMSVPRQPRFFDPAQWQTLCALCDRIIPQPQGKEPVPLAAMLDARLLSGRTDGFRRATLPQQDEAWRRGLAALDTEARARHGAAFHELKTEDQEQLLHKVQGGEVSREVWGDMSSQEFFCHRVLLDIAAAYYAHPTAWNEIGFGGPASPRGYVRMDFDRRDPWEAAEAHQGEEEQARRDNQRVR